MMKKSETGLGGREGAMIGTYKNIFIDFYVRICFQKINFHLLTNFMNATVTMMCREQILLM